MQIYPIVKTLCDGKYLISRLGYEDCMLKLCGIASVPGLHGPSIIEKLGLMRSGIDHRLYREDHACFHKLSRIPWRLMIDIGFLVELDTGAVSCIFTHNSVSMPFRMTCDLVSYVPETVSRVDLFDTDLETRPGHIDEFFSGLRRFSDYVHPGSIPDISAQNRSDVNIQNITFLKNLFRRGESVTYDIVERDTGILRISALAPAIIPFVVDASRNPSVFQYECITDLIEFIGGDARLYVVTDHIEDGCGELR